MPLRYVILHHEGIPEPHYDVMFETEPGSMLATWRVETWPMKSATPLCLERLPDHRRAYLEFEGEITGGRGRVRRVAAGDCKATIETSEWRVQLLTGSHAGTLTLRRTDGEVWTGLYTSSDTVGK